MILLASIVLVATSPIWILSELLQPFTIPDVAE